MDENIPRTTAPPTAEEKQVRLLRELVNIGLALSREKHLHKLLEMIVSEARRFTSADGGTLYIRREHSPLLDFAILQNDTLGIRRGGDGEEINWEPVPLYLADGSENHRNVSAHCALVGAVINISDVYSAAGFDFQGTREFDRHSGYRSRSMLVIPLRDHEDEVIGVVQLLNARNPLTGEVTDFPEVEARTATSLASLAAIAITKMRLIKGLEDLLDAFVKAIAAAIDEKSHYTAGHIARVTALTERLALALNRGEGQGNLAGERISPEDMESLRLAAWLHDVGKITTPEHVVDKATKLEAILDRIELIRYRVEILKRDMEIAFLRQQLAGAPLAGEEELRRRQEQLDGDFAFLQTVNHGSEFLADDLVARIRQIGDCAIEIGGTCVPLLSENEVHNLQLRRGTLNYAERTIINNHVRMTIKMLENLPYPKKLRKVPLFAGLHHEKLDGTGYPMGVAGAEIPIPARMLAVADVFEALTAADRPYKPGKRLSEAMTTLDAMVREDHLDGAVCDLLVDSGIVTSYAQEMLPDAQRDAFFWRGRRYEA